MNEKIKQLAEQAGLKPCNQRIVSIDIEADTFETEPCWGEFEKFAELIIKECAGVCLCIGSGDNETELLKHFGVEE